MIKQIFKTGMVLLLTGCCWMACRKNDDNSPYQTHLAVSNFLLNADSLRILYDEGVLTGNTALGFGATSRRDSLVYLLPPAGVHEMRIVVNGRSARQKTFQAGAGKFYSLLVYDSLKADTVKTVLLEDAIASIDSVAQLRFINIIPGADSLRLTLSRDTISITTGDVYVGLKSSPVYAFSQHLKKGNWTLKLLRGTATIAQADSMPLANGRLYTVIAKGQPGGSGARAQGLVVLRNY